MSKYAGEQVLVVPRPLFDAIGTFHGIRTHGLEEALEKLLSWFFDLHDPTTLNRQGADVGTQYRSAIFYHTDAQKAVAEASKKALGKKLEDPVVTEITKAGTFYPAEKYHQDYYFQNKSNGYCRAVIQPKLKKLKLDN